ncbi:hypothetical protein [Streptomyces sp. NPDC002537]
MKLKVVLDRVTCRDTEDIVGADEFYVRGTVTTSLVSKFFLTEPMNIRVGQTLSFDKDQRIIFEGDLPKSGEISVALEAWDSDSGKGWEEGTYRKVLNEIGGAFADKAPTAIAAALKSSDVKASSTKAGDTKASSTKADDTKASSTKASSTKAGDTKAGDTKAGDTKASSTKAGDTKVDATKPAVQPAAGPDLSIQMRNLAVDAALTPKVGKAVLEIADQILSSVVASVDADDALGFAQLDLAIADLGTEACVKREVVNFKQEGIGVSTWDYDLHYSIHVEP